MANKTLQLKIGNTTYRSSVDNTLTNEDLNNVTLPGLYNAGCSNSVTNKPSGIDHFGLLVIHRASGSYYIQIIYNDSKSYRRFCVNGTWGNWTEDKLTDTTYTSLKNPHALTLKINSASGTAYDGSSPITYDITKTALGLNKVDNTADADKTVDRANKLKLLASSRPDSLNFDLTKDQYRANITYNIATSSTKVGKCPNDAHVLTFGWDTSAGWGAQMAISDGSSPKVYVRGSYSKNNACAWDTEWKTLAFTSDIPDALPRSGGAMKGNISYTGTQATYEMIKFIDNKADTYGNGIAIGGGGLTVIGGGESAEAYVGSISSDGVGGEEQLVLCNDSGIDFYTNCQSGMSSAKHCSIDNSGGAHFNAVYNAVYNDYAEFFPRGEATEPGDIVALDLTSDHESYIKATATSKIVAGVHSDEYAMLIGGDKVDDGNYVEKNLVNYIPVSLAGRVMCKVTGPVHRGDTIIVSDIPGVGIATDDENIPHKRVVGYVVEDDDRTDIRRVKIRVKG